MRLDDPIFLEETSEADSFLPLRAHRTIHDSLYGPLPISRWAQTLLETEPFVRLAGVSLSDSPGEFLVKRPFPTRLTHSIGVYYLARQARPRDRALQAAALAHDLGHGPFSHLTEPLMIERLGIDHERRSVALLRRAVGSLRGADARLLSWLDLDEVAALMLGESADGRGRLLNGLMDYDNLDNVARFLQAAGLGEPGYDPRALARDLRLVTSADGDAPIVALPAAAALHAHAWLDDRRRIYRYLDEGERNVAIHGMLRKAVDLAAQAGLLTPEFFDATDTEALRLLRVGTPGRRSVGATALAQAVSDDALYQMIWDATVPESATAIPPLFAQWRSRLTIEQQIATEAGLLPYEVALSEHVSRGERALPPLLASERSRAEQAASGVLTRAASPSVPLRRIQLLAPRSIGRDYVRRARMAAERALGALGAIPRGWNDPR